MFSGDKDRYVWRPDESDVPWRDQSSTMDYATFWRSRRDTDPLDLLRLARPLLARQGARFRIGDPHIQAIADLVKDRTARSVYTVATTA